MLFECVCPNQISDPKNWSKKLAKVISLLYSGTQLKDRIRILMKNLRKNEDNLAKLTYYQLATFNNEELSKGTPIISIYIKN